MEDVDVRRVLVALSAHELVALGGILDLLEALAEGLDIDGALRSTFGDSYEEICRSWAESLAEPRG